MALRLRRGSNADRLLITPLEGELVYTTDSKLIYIGDGATVGGVLVGIQALGSNLNLSGNDIVGTGNINITGTITASGDINLGDGVGGDTIGIQGNITSNLLPNVDSNYNIGSGSLRWNNIFSTGVDVGGQINAETINSNIVADDSTISYNKASNTFNGVFDGDLSGSVFADDSTLIVDSVSNAITTSRLSVTDVTSAGTDLKFNAVTTNFNRAQSTSSKVFVHSTTSTGFGTDLFNLVNTHANVFTDDLAFSRARGTPDSLVVINANDKLGGIAFNGHDGSAYQFGASIDSYATAISTGNITTKVRIRTRNGAFGTVGVGLQVEADQTVKLNTLGALTGDTININNFMQLPISTSAPSSPANGMIAIADGSSWDPVSSVAQAVVAFINGAWRRLDSAL